MENIVGARVLLADGETIKDLTLHGSTGEDKELLFAIRGAASAVGIVLEITCRTYPMENVTGGITAALLHSPTKPFRLCRSKRRKARGHCRARCTWPQSPQIHLSRPKSMASQQPWRSFATLERMMLHLS